MPDRKLDHISLCANLPHFLSGEKGAPSLWKVELDLADARAGEMEQSLSPDEAARADRFHSARDRQRFVAARGSLRAILSESLHIQADQIRFAYTLDQKPVLAHPASAPEEALLFNVSHSDALALIAVTRGREVGVDLERLRADFDPDALAARFFSPVEAAALSRMPLRARHHAFLAYWVCKEAYLKACGTGLRQPLNSFTVSLKDPAIRLAGPSGQAEAVVPYRVHWFNPDAGYVAAVAVKLL